MSDSQTSFWLPVLQDTAAQATGIAQEMLELISDFYDKNTDPVGRVIPPRGNNHRQVILGDMTDAEVAKTFVEVVPKSENTRYKILHSLKVSSVYMLCRDHT